jgi:hypothetical protein
MLDLAARKVYRREAAQPYADCYRSLQDPRARRAAVQNIFAEKTMLAFSSAARNQK